MPLLLWLLFADVAAPAPAFSADCEARLRQTAHAFSAAFPKEEAFFDLVWHFRVRKDAIDVQYDAAVDMCGIYDDSRIRLRRGKPPVLRKVQDDGHDFERFRRLFQPVTDACTR